MVERTRAHVRLTATEVPGIRRTVDGPLGKPIALFVPKGVRAGRGVQLVVHFHGAAFVAEKAVAALGKDYVLAVVNVGAGSGAYDRAFSDPPVFDSLLSNVRREVSAALGAPAVLRTTTLVGFSAGHGAIRAILRDSAHFAQVNAVLLLDGLHTSYVPEGTVVEKGGQLDEKHLEALVRFGRAALRGEKRLLVTHSEIFPGTFASTTETTDYLVSALGLRRIPVLKWGPGGMQQLSEAHRAGVEILGFAGNTAPDHIDHLHGMPEFLRRLAARMK
ncbi:MAG: hypothetical protein V4550_14875 [Gemmatimonadota bacterium]